MVRVIIVDDDEDLLDSLSQLLSMEKDFDVIGTALNGKNAIKLTHSLRPDLVLMDIKMPEMDGVLAAEVIKTESPDTRVVLMTGYEGLYDIRHLEIDGFLRKPDDVMDVAAKIRKYCDM